MDYTTGVGPMTLVGADFNGDGFLDLAVVDTCGTNCGFVSILLGKGDGTFQANTDYPVGQSPYGIVVQDFNGDGKLDLAVANTSNTISILLGNADGTFQPHKDATSVNAPAALAVGDFDGDKIPDLVISHAGAPWALTFMKGNGDGTFGSEQQIGNSVDTYDTNNLTTVDVNGDGNLDIVLTDVAQAGVIVFLAMEMEHSSPRLHTRPDIIPSRLLFSTSMATATSIALSPIRKTTISLFCWVTETAPSVRGRLFPPVLS